MRCPIFKTIVGLTLIFTTAGLQAEKLPKNWRKTSDVVIYQNEKFHSAFPSVIRRPDGELLVAFRRAPDRRPWGETKVTHTDANSYLVLARSANDGQTWSEPETFFAHPFGGSQDPCLLQLRDRSILCASYGWAWQKTNHFAKMKSPLFTLGNFVFLGGYVLRSRTGGDSWEPPMIPAHCPVEVNFDIFGQPIPAYNRGAMCEGKDGRIFWVSAANHAVSPRRISAHLMISADKGTTWNYSCPVAEDAKVDFNETSIYETPQGDLVAFLRTDNFGDHGAIARSTDGGKSFQKWEDMGFQGHPFHALRLPDQRVLLTYGYRHNPPGIRARILDAECTNFKTAPEIILRDDGQSWDLGYPWAVMLSKQRVLVTYYFNQKDGPRFIAGTFLETK